MSVGGWRPPEPTGRSSGLGRGARTASMWGARGLGADGPVWPQGAAPCALVSSLEGQWPPSRAQGGGRHSEEARLKTPATPRWRGQRASSSEVEDTGEHSPPPDGRLAAARPGTRVWGSRTSEGSSGSAQASFLTPGGQGCPPSGPPTHGSLLRCSASPPLAGAVLRPVSWAGRHGMPSFGPGRRIPLGPVENWKSRTPADASPPLGPLTEEGSRPGQDSSILSAQ